MSTVTKAVAREPKLGPEGGLLSTVPSHEQSRGKGIGGSGADVGRGPGATGGKNSKGGGEG